MKTSCKIEEIDTILEMLSMGVLVVSSEGFLEEINDKGLELLGVSNKESIKRLSIASSPVIPNSIKESFIKRETIHENFLYDFSKVRKLNYYETSRDCEKIRVNFKGKPIFNSCGKFEKYIFIIEDVTEAYNKEQILSETQLKLSLTLEIGDTTVWGYNLASRCFYNIHGSTVEDNASLFDERKSLVHPDDRDSIISVFEKLLNGDILNAIKSFRIKNLHTNEYEYIRISMSIVLSEDGVLDRIVGVRRNITEEVLSKQKIEEALIASLKDVTNLNESLTNLYNESQAIIQLLPIGIAVFDKYGVQQYVNDTLLKTFGIGDAGSHLEKAINIFEDPIFPIEDLNRLKMGENINNIYEYDLQTVNDTCFFDTIYKHKVYFVGKAMSVKDSNGEILKYIFVSDDITEKRRAELILENSERNLKLALEAGSVESWLYNIKSEISYLVGGRSTFGEHPITREAGKELVHPDDVDTRAAMINDIIQGKIDKCHIILRYKSNPLENEYRYYDTRMIAQKEDDLVVAIAFTHKDITDDYLHEIEREYNQKRVEFTIDTAELALWEYDVLKHEFVIHNNAIVKLESANGLSIEEYSKSLNPDESSSIELNKMISAMNEGADISNSAEIKIKPKSASADEDEWRYYTVGGSTFEKDEDGRVIKYVGFIKNNTKWITLNDKLVLLNSQLETVLDIGQIFPFICEVKNDKFYFSAPTLTGEVNIFPVALNTELTLEQVLMAFSSENEMDMGDILTGIAMGNISELHTEIRWSSESANNQVYELNISVIRDQDFKGSLKIIGYMQDVTERNQMISDLKEAKQEAEQLAKLKSSFLANMSHEIRTPLNAIVGFSELLIDEEDKEVKSEYLGIISTNNDLLLKLINDILDLSKIDAGLTDLDVSEFDFSQFFNELYLSMQHRITGSNVRFSILNPYSKCIVELDKNRLAQICMNYVTNAIKYTPKGFIDMGYECVNGGVKLYVKDTGIGIADDKQHKLFQRFEKLDDFAQGTGLGLSITKALVESMNGEVGFESKEGSGSIFWAWIPCKFSIK